MDPKRFVVATLVGGLVLYLSGYLIFTVAFGGFYAANAGSAVGVDRDSQLIWAMAIGNLAYAALVTYTMSRGSPSLSLGGGATVGAIVGFLIWATTDFINYGGTNVANLTRTIVDPLLEIVHGGIAGAAIVAVLRQMPAAAKTAA